MTSFIKSPFIPLTGQASVSKPPSFYSLHPFGDPILSWRTSVLNTSINVTNLFQNTDSKTISLLQCPTPIFGPHMDLSCFVWNINARGKYISAFLQMLHQFHACPHWTSSFLFNIPNNILSDSKIWLCFKWNLSKKQISFQRKYKYIIALWYRIIPCGPKQSSPSHCEGILVGGFLIVAS